MSRIGKAPISIPQGVTITIKENIVTYFLYFNLGYFPSYSHRLSSGQ